MDNRRRPRIIINRLIQRCHGGYTYHFCKMSNNRVIYYLRCKFARNGCHGTGIINSRGQFRVTNPRHTCGAERPNLQTERQLLDSLRSVCTHQFRNVEELYDQVIRLYPGMRNSIPYREISRRMKRWQKHANFPVANSFTVFANILRHLDYHNLLDHNFGSMNVYSTNVSAVFGDRNLANGVSDVENDERVMYINNSKTILSTHNICNNINFITFINPFKRYGIPTGWAILSEESEEIYSTICDNYFDRIGPALNPIIIYTNFNRHLQLSLQQKFLGANIKTLFMPYFLDVVHNATLNHLDLNNVNVKNNIKKLISIALMPAAVIPQAYLTFKNEILENEGERYNGLLMYFLNIWIRTVGPAKLSFFNDINAFKNVIDGHLRMIEYDMRNARDIWDLTRVMFKNHVKYHEAVEKLNGAHHTNIPKVSAINNIITLPRLTDLWTRWANNRLNIREFLETASNLFDQLLIDVIHRNEPEGLNEDDYVVGDDRFENVLHEQNEQIVVDDAENPELVEAGPPEELEEEIEMIVDDDDDDDVIEDAEEIGIEFADRDGQNEYVLQEQVEAAVQNADEVPVHDYVTPGGMCLTCETRAIQIRFQPCRHVLMCQICVIRYRNERQSRGLPFVCIICQNEVEFEMI